jgi:hypothetical protein
MVAYCGPYLILVPEGKRMLAPVGNRTSWLRVWSGEGWAAGMSMIRFPRFDLFQVAITLFGAAFFVGLSLIF